MSTKKYVSLNRLSNFLDNLRNTFSALTHTHTITDITDYVVDSEMSSTSVNPVQNNVINTELNTIKENIGSSILYTEQTLTESQKEQARTNIGAATVSDVLASLPTWTGGSY